MPYEGREERAIYPRDWWGRSSSKKAIQEGGTRRHSAPPMILTGSIDLRSGRCHSQSSFTSLTDHSGPKDPLRSHRASWRIPRPPFLASLGALTLVKLPSLPL
jgi:hypothetical protein